MTSNAAPSPLVLQDGPRLSRHLADIVGGRLLAVVYANYEGNALPTGWEARTRHGESVDLAVALEFETGWLRNDWAMPSITLGLAVEAAPRLQFGTWGVMRVEGSPLWLPVLGNPVTGFQLAWFRAEEEAEISLLALRVRSEEASLIITLGEVDADGLKYMPDCLAVVSGDLGENSVARLGGTWDPEILVQPGD